MIPIRLTIEGLFSYQEKQTIDFSTLCETRLFGIFGAVGSGKSSILEAMMFALYNKTDRLSYANQGYNMMNLRSDRLFIDFIFASGGKEYRFTVEGKRHGKDFEKVGTFDRNAYVKSSDDWEPLPFHVADDILGLSYDNFRRTIIIPQGKFQEFLQLGETDRTRMMKEIFRLDRFDLKDAATSLEFENNTRLENLVGQLVTLVDVDDEKLKDLQKRKELLGKEISGLKKIVEQKEKELQQWKERKKTFEDWRSEQLKLDRLKEQESGYRKRRDALEKLAQTKEKLAVPLDRLKKAEEQLSSVEMTIQKTKLEIDRAQNELKTNQGKIEQLTISEEEDQKEKRIIEDLERLGEIRQLEKEMVPVSRRKKELEEDQAAIVRKSAPLEEQKQKLESEKEKLDSAMGPVESISSWMARVELTLEQGQQLKMQRKELLISEEKWNREFARISWPGKAKDPDIKDYPGAVNEGLNMAERQLEQARKEQLNISREELAHQWRKDLEEGKPCPVCGSTHHPGKTHPLEREVIKGKDNIGELEKIREQWKDAAEKIRRSWPEGQVLSKEKIALEKKLKEVSENFIQLKSEYPTTGVTIPEAKEEFRKFISELKEKLSRQTEIDKLFKSLVQREKELVNGKESVDKELTSVKEQWIRLETRKNDALSKLKVLQGTEDWISGHDPLELMKKRMEERENREKNLKELNNSIKEWEKSLHGHQQVYGDKEKEKAGLDLDVEKQYRELKKLIEELGFESLDDARDLLLSKVDPARERKEIEEYFQEVNTLTALVIKLEKSLSEHPFDKEAFTAFEKEFNELENQLQDLVRQEATVEAQRERMSTDLEKKKALISQKKALEARAENIRTLKNLFRSAGFVKYISRVYLENICRAANERFTTLTRRQLALQLNEKNEFEVIDFLNDGRVRSIRTLSGGQTFQASLCLALALAESVQAQAKTRQNFFFLDEGFGSLDRDSLEVVFKTLKSLRNEDRIVGIISHVEDLQQEIQSFVHIERDPEKGSRIVYSWE